MGLFDEKYTATIPKTKLKQMEKEFVDDKEYCKQQYERFKHLIPGVKFSIVSNFSDEDKKHFFHGVAWWLNQNAEQLLESDAKKKNQINFQDLRLLLNMNVKAINKGDNKLAKTNHGLKFLDYFIRDGINATNVQGKKSPLENSKDLKQCYVVAVRTAVFKFDFTEANLLSRLKLINTQPVWNFRTPTAAYIYQTYGVEAFPNEDTINLRCPSEGWLARLLATYYVAYHNPNKQINYVSTDPNKIVVDQFHNVTKVLKNYGGFKKVTNWNPRIFMQGSEIPESNFSKTLGMKFHCSFTSPPYFGIEQYLETYKVVMKTKSGKEIKEAISETAQFTHTASNEVKSIKDIYLGEYFIYNGEEVQLIDKQSVGQSHKAAETFNGWNEFFLRPTIQNQYKDLVDGGYMVLNVSDVKVHPTLEADTVRIAEEEGFKLVDTLYYMLTRPSWIPNKKPYEPIFVFQKQ